MRDSVILPGGGAAERISQAVLAEGSGWDGVFVWEAAYGVDAWSLLAAIDVRTTRVTIGTLLTLLPAADRAYLAHGATWQAVCASS